MENKIIIVTGENKVSRETLKDLAEKMYGEVVKAVVDVEKRIMVIGGDLHADEEQVLLRESSKQGNLWGINLYPQRTNKEFIEFDSMINVRPSQDNRSRSVENPLVREVIVKIVKELIV